MQIFDDTTANRWHFDDTMAHTGAKTEHRGEHLWWQWHAENWVEQLIPNS
jgi:hypothetical protein